MIKLRGGTAKGLQVLHKKQPVCRGAVTLAMLAAGSVNKLLYPFNSIGQGEYIKKMVQAGGSQPQGNIIPCMW